MGWRRWSMELCLFFHIVSWLGGDAVDGGGGEEENVIIRDTNELLLVACSFSLM